MTLLRWAGRVVIAATAVAGVLTWVALPPAAVVLHTAAWTPTRPVSVVRGVYHVHTRRSDGTGTVEEVAAAAGAVGLDFLVLTDHGDATRTPDPPRYVRGVLVVDAVEISTAGGHYAALGLRGPSPYRLGGAPADVVEDVARMGGFGIVTHPDSPKRSLAWRDWSLPVEAFEWVNGDTEWRDERTGALARTLLTYPFRAPASISALFARPVQTLERWDRLIAEGRHLVAMAGADAHARLGVRDDDEAEGPAGLALPLPSYRAVFRTFSTFVELERPFGGKPEDDAARLIEAMRKGRTYTAITAFAGPPRFEFYARTAAGIRSMGEALDPGEAATLIVRGLAPPGTRWRLLRNGTAIAESSGLELAHDVRAGLATGEGGAGYRVEAAAGEAGRAMPWIVSNPIFVTRPADRPAGEDVPQWGSPDNRRGIDLRACRSEKDALSNATIEVDEAGEHLGWRWRLGGDTTPGWVALACAIDGLPSAASAIGFSASADAPMRLSVQVREGAPGEQRWSRTVYVDQQARTYHVPVSALTPVGSGRAQPGGDVKTLLFVVDWVHGRAGMQRAVRLERAGFEPSAGDQVRTVNSR